MHVDPQRGRPGAAGGAVAGGQKHIIDARDAWGAGGGGAGMCATCELPVLMLAMFEVAWC